MKKFLLAYILIFSLVSGSGTVSRGDTPVEKSAAGISGTALQKMPGNWWNVPEQEEIASKIPWDYNTFMGKTYEVLRKSNPDYILRAEISKDTSGEFSIWKYEFRPKVYTQTILLTAGIHGEEYEGYWGLYYFLKALCNKSDKSRQLEYIRNNVRIVVIPVLNPYGVEHKSRVNARGVECNKNFGIFWGLHGYENEGSSAFSEKESLAVKTICDEYNDDFSFYIDFHTDPYDPYLGAYCTIDDDSGNHALVLNLANEEKQKWASGYNKTIPGLVVDKARCSAVKYLNKVRGIPSVLVEYGPAQFDYRGSSTEMTVALEWYANCVIRHVEADFKKSSGMDAAAKKYLDSIKSDPLRRNGFLKSSSAGLIPDHLTGWYDGADFLNLSKPVVLNDRSGSKHNAKLKNFNYTNTSGSDGKKKIAFDGNNDRMEIPISLKDFTLQWKMQIDDNNNYGRILSSNNDSIRLFFEKTGASSAKIFFNEYKFYNYTYSYGKEIILALKRSGNILTLYIDGVCVSSYTTDRTPLEGIFIGNNPVLDRGLYGTISSFLVYDRALTEKEIYQNYKAS